ncbi:MAG TPA: 4-hydroxy-tetrahydrodipicolinate reductase, partial [Acidimicrobiales bacterium]|nr:4-hydroxy-tetrahydrodipicolinate reductase [Acidimicrobiales bacterium]
MIKVGVFGAAGRMGQEVCRAVAEDPDLELVARVDPQAGLGDDMSVADVAVDFTVASSARANARWCAEHGV